MYEASPAQHFHYTLVVHAYSKTDEDTYLRLDYFLGNCIWHSPADDPTHCSHATRKLLSLLLGSSISWICCSCSCSFFETQNQLPLFQVAFLDHTGQKASLTPLTSYGSLVFVSLVTASDVMFSTDSRRATITTGRMALSRGPFVFLIEKTRNRLNAQPQGTDSQEPRYISTMATMFLIKTGTRGFVPLCGNVPVIQ